MKNISIYSLALFFLLGLASCEKLVEGYDEDPNNPSDAPAEVMIAGVEVANAFVHEGELARTAGMWSRYFTGSDRQYVSYETYDVNSGDFDNAWGNVYADVIDQARIVQNKAEPAGNKALVGVAQVLEAHTLGTATALWGAVPNKEAANVDVFQNPAFENQDEVYASLQVLLDDALANVEGAGNEYSSVTQLGSWTEVAHSLKARYYLHTGAYQKAIDEAELGISSVANEWVATHFYEGNLASLQVYYNFLDVDRGGYMTADNSYCYGLLKEGHPDYHGNSKTNEATRQEWFYDDAASCGYSYGDVDPNFCSGAFDWVTSFPMFSYVENQLIIAEAKARLNDDAGALVNLNNVRAHNEITFPAASGVAFEAYIMADFDAGGMVNDGNSVNSSILKEVLTEKYISLCGQIEGFTDLRRTDNMIGVPPSTGTQIPERFLYPQSEINSNTSIPSPVPGLFEPI